MNRICRIAMGLALIFAVSPLPAEKEEKRAARRASIDTMAEQTLEQLFEQSPRARETFEKSPAYAVFDNVKVAFLLSGGGGVGVAVTKGGERTYMKMGTGGIGVGLGAQSYQVVFLFEDDKVYRRFVDKGWQADASANAAAGTAGKNAGSPFSHGVAVYQITNKGLMAQADVSGTKYWKNKKLNEY
jgi:lipid-binding SYLF domain-containing protein